MRRDLDESPLHLIAALVVVIFYWLLAAHEIGRFIGRLA